MESTFDQFAQWIALVLEVISVIVIAIGGVAAVYSFFKNEVRHKHINHRIREAWLGYARWMLLGLEFTLAADVVRTTISPTWSQIGELAAIAIIRTFLNYFLERDLEHATALKTSEAT